MDLIVDEDVKAVLEFMQHRMPASKLMPAAEAIGKMGPVLWGHHGKEDFIPLFLRGDIREVTSLRDLHKQSSANE